MESLYLINAKDEIILEHNWRGRSLRSAVEAFIAERARQVENRHSVPPVLELSLCLIFHITTGSLTIVCATTKEVESASVFDLLYRLASVFEEYFGVAVATSDLLSNNFDTVTELLSEVVDNGYALTTEPNAIRDVVLPPSLLNKLMNVAGMQSGFEGQNQLSTIPWRRAKVKHTNNEIFVDVQEQLTAIVDKTGRFVQTSISGNVGCTTKLSGVPEVILELKPADIIKLPSFHPSVNLTKFETTPGLLSFIPPEGAFSLLTYSSQLSTDSSSPLPFSLEFRPGKDTQSFDVVLSTRSGVPDSIAVELPLPSVCRDVRLSATRGTFSAVKGPEGSSPILLRWLISGNTSSKGISNRQAVLTCTNTGTGLNAVTYARLVSTLPTSAVTGIKVNSLKIQRSGEWKPYKGVKYMTKVDMIYRAH
ncbi:protein of unknown function [Taphrina deformans PYCC 5710]|uniref:MHD domain-containing protein n=1 Tax=Taphrina deformans (strain PYCC 5710 / ATCC 11124 / CBS 356.35 / IMI 108563 / JCM 9778 / NBRC 8474) TaxID=1097556 RepID=R4XCY5_TAPDE|nr:protein of unknown function [Taphrina deformans PYCC 5710]|eukprot:CCG83736.1 protein of unknown function [Taphrina deformans PYCC 5710]